MTELLPDDLRRILADGTVVSLIGSLIILVVGLAIARGLAAVAARILVARDNEQAALVAQKFVFYGLAVIAVLAALDNAGIEVGVVLGAAGILTVALGFASQTAASNLISGLFLLGERPFTVGEVIDVGGTRGEVLSIDLLSVKLRTYDNLFVRIPNETLIKTQISNITRFPIRRADLKIGVAYKEDLARVRDILMDVASGNPLCLERPVPVVILLGYGSSSIDIQFNVWAAKDNFLEMRNQMYEQIKARFDAEGIEIPFPHVSLYAGSATGPVPVALTAGKGMAGNEPDDSESV